MAPVIGALRERFPDWHAPIVHTGQHYDRLMSEIFLEELGVPEPDHLLGWDRAPTPGRPRRGWGQTSPGAGPGRPPGG